MAGAARVFYFGGRFRRHPDLFGNQLTVSRRLSPGLAFPRCLHLGKESGTLLGIATCTGPSVGKGFPFRLNQPKKKEAFLPVLPEHLSVNFHLLKGFVLFVTCVSPIGVQGNRFHEFAPIFPGGLKQMEVKISQEPVLV